MHFKFNSSVQLPLPRLSAESLPRAEERCKDVGCMLIQLEMPSCLSTHGKFPHHHLLDKCTTVFSFNTLPVWGELLGSVVAPAFLIKPKQTGVCEEGLWHWAGAGAARSGAGMLLLAARPWWVLVLTAPANAACFELENHPAKK